MVPMRQIFKYVLLLILLTILLTCAGYLIILFSGIDLLLSDIIILSSLFSLISIITLAVFFRGTTKEPDSQTMHTLVSISLKFLLDMVLALVWLIISKKTSLASVFLFFVIYLTLTLFTLFVILKTLRNRSL
jgi:O-antigen ligase